VSGLLRVLSRLLRGLLERIERRIDEAPRPMQTFSYRKPVGDDPGAQQFVLLGRTDHIRGAVHIVRDEGGENLHSHRTIDGFWMVLSGRARFHDDNGPVGEFGPGQGIVTPRNVRYRFERIGDGDLELLQVLAFDPLQGWHRENHAPPSQRESKLHKYDGRQDNRRY
jgi:mannose-6-phosphate isomerase-like protein (cupin superfamily)